MVPSSSPSLFYFFGKIVASGTEEKEEKGHTHTYTHTHTHTPEYSQARVYVAGDTHETMR